LNPCPRCGKPANVCVCDRIAAQPVSTRVLVLQHPQEQDVVLGTAPLLASMVGATVKVGLSWPNLAAALGETPVGRWGVLYPMSLPGPAAGGPYAVLDRSGAAVLERLSGLILLDGTWSQAKALWWRNPWLVRLDRVLVTPTSPSIYGRLRREPRKEFVSTLEACAGALVGNGEPESTRQELFKAMRTMVQRARDAS
jgi:DTW domain-containing protein YfiP